MMATARTQSFAFEFTNNDGLYISSDRRRQPESPPAAVRIAHDLAEHVGYDADWIQALIEAGIVVYDNQPRGPSSRLPRFWPITVALPISVLTSLSIDFSGVSTPLNIGFKSYGFLLTNVEALCRVPPHDFYRQQKRNVQRNRLRGSGAGEHARLDLLRAAAIPLSVPERLQRNRACWHLQAGCRRLRDRSDL